MKIFHITDHLPGYHKIWGGAEQVAYRYIKLETETCMVGTVKPIKPIRENFSHKRIRVAEDYFTEKFQVYITGIKNRIFSFDPVSFVHLIWIFYQEKPDIVHFHKFNKISFSAILAAKIMGAKTVLGIYDYWYLCPGGMLIDKERNLCRKFHGSWCQNCSAVTDFRILLPFISPIRRPLFNFFLNRIDAFAVLSDSLRNLLKEYGVPSKKIYLIRQVSSFNKIKKYPSRQKNLILFVGWIDPRKGLDIAIKTISLIIKKFPNSKLIIIGEALDKNYEQLIKQLIVNLGLKDKVVMLGKLSFEETSQYFQKCSILLLPEQWENMSPVVLIEAMTFGIPVIASRIGGIPEFIQDGETGFLVNRTKPVEFAKKSILLFNDPSLSIKISRKAKKEILGITDSKLISENLSSMYRLVIC